MNIGRGEGWPALSPAEWFFVSSGVCSWNDYTLTGFFSARTRGIRVRLAVVWREDVGIEPSPPLRQKPCQTDFLPVEKKCVGCLKRVYDFAVPASVFFMLRQQHVW